MNRILRAILPVIAVVSIVFFCNPAVAGMVATKHADADVARETALSTLQAKLAQAGPLTPEVSDKLHSLPTSDLVVLASAAESLVPAGTVVIYVSLGAVLLVAAIVTLIIILVVIHHSH